MKEEAALKYATQINIDQSITYCVIKNTLSPFEGELSIRTWGVIFWFRRKSRLKEKINANEEKSNFSNRFLQNVRYLPKHISQQ